MIGAISNSIQPYESIGWASGCYEAANPSDPVATLPALMATLPPLFHSVAVYGYPGLSIKSSYPLWKSCQQLLGWSISTCSAAWITAWGQKRITYYPWYKLADWTTSNSIYNSPVQFHHPRWEPKQQTRTITLVVYRSPSHSHLLRQPLVQARGVEFPAAPAANTTADSRFGEFVGSNIHSLLVVRCPILKEIQSIIPPSQSQWEKKTSTK